jgi:cation transport regulator ChaB
MTEIEKGDVEENNEEEQEEEQEEESSNYITRDEFEEIKSGLVEEIKETRKKKQEAEADRDLLKSDKEDENKDEVDKKIEEALSNKEQEEVKRNQESAKELFKDKNKELKEDADAGDIKWSAVEKQLGRFDMSKARSEKDFQELYQDAYRLARKESSNDSGSKPSNPYSSDSNAVRDTSGSNEESVSLSEREKQVVERIGWSEEKFLEQKKRRPSYVNGLINSPY